LICKDYLYGTYCGCIFRVAKNLRIDLDLDNDGALAVQYINTTKYLFLPDIRGLYKDFVLLSQYDEFLIDSDLEVKVSNVLNSPKLDKRKEIKYTNTRESIFVYDFDKAVKLGPGVLSNT